MTLLSLIRRAVKLPPHVLLRKSWGFAARRLAAKRQRLLDRWRPSFAPASPCLDLHTYIVLGAEDVPEDLASALPAMSGRIVAHQFDLLGSGRTPVHHGVACQGADGVGYPPAAPVDADLEGGWLTGRINAANLNESKRLWRLVDRSDYRPIDWQLDFKSGYRWSEGKHFRGIVYGHTAGAEVKVPWELARMQHLTWLAVACLLARAGHPGFAQAEVYSGEIRNQILDFLAANPPRFGVNWCCPMDVGIRIANCLLALDILHGAGVRFDAPFREAVSRAALEHGRHIAAHLEWSETGRSNHYLSNVVGLLFVAAYLPRSPETDAWLAFAVQQLETEIGIQFGVDGGNYEGSTAYHCLSAELALYGVALTLGLPDEKMSALQSFDRRAIRVRPPFDPAPMPLHDLPGGRSSPLAPVAVERLGATGRFLQAVTKPSGRILQVGDTDSGRLFKLHAAWNRTKTGEWEEDDLDRRALLEAIGVVVADRSGSEGFWLDSRVVRSLVKGNSVVPHPAQAPSLPSQDLPAVLGQISGSPADNRRTTELPLPSGLDPEDGLSIAVFPEFGLYILRGPRLFLSLRCAGHARTDAPSGHTHDDNLAIELQIDGRDVIMDPGSYVYTPFPAIRERYRGAGAHLVPRAVDRQAAVPEGLFGLRHLARATCLHVSRQGLAGRLDGPDWQAWRVVELLPNALRITDACAPGPLAPIPPDPPQVSNGYGKRTESPAYSL